MTMYLFDSHGGWIAYLHSPTSTHVFNPQGECVGWRPFADADV